MWTLWWQVKHWLAYRNGPRVDKIFCSKFFSIKERCKNPQRNKKNKNYKWIKCEWNNLLDFKNDMYESYLEHVNKFWINDTQIDRIDPRWNYCKENCRWATKIEQAYNKKNTLYIDIDWVRYTTETFAKKYWISTELASTRISHYLKWNATLKWICTYWKVDNEIRSKLWTKVYITVDGKKYSYRDIASITWITYEGAKQRWKLFQEWKITEDELFKKWHRDYLKHSIICTIDWKEYNKDTLAKEVWCNSVTARWRIKKFNKWEISKEELFKRTK